METEKGSIRAFVAVTLTPGMLAHLETVQRELSRAIGEDLVRWTPPEQIHLTLKFFGHLPIEQVPNIVMALREAARPSAPFELSLEGLGAFPSVKRPNVIWIGLAGEIEILQQLQSQIERLTGGTGSHAEERAFRPHLTIGRVRSRERQTREITRALQQFAPPHLPEWPVRELHLVKSELSPKGSIYTSLEIVPLR